MWEVCSGPSVNANVSPPISKYMNDDSNGFESSQHRDGQQILKPFSTDNEYKSEIFLQSVLDLHKTNKLNRNEDENTRIWSSGGRTSDQNGSRNLFSPKSASEDHNRFQTQLHPNNQINAGHDDVANIHDGIGRDGKASEDQSTGVTSSNGATVANKTFRTIRCYHCRMCDQEFVNKSDMQRHAKEVHRLEDKGYKCVKCLKTFPSSQQLAQHALVHTNVRKYPCRFCDKSFKQLSHVQQHLRIHTGERPYQCTVEGCSKAFRQLSSLQQHIKGHNIPLPKSYPILHPIPTSDPAESKDKIRTNLARPTDLICQVCEKHCTDEIRYFQHIHKYHPDFWRVFSGGRPLSDYIEDENRPNSKQYRCNICEKSCSSESSYWKHLSSHPGATTNPGAMHQGVMNRVGGNVGSAEDDQLQIYTCKVCQKLFTKEAHLVRHMEMRLDEHHSAGLLELKKSRPAFRDSKDGSVRTPHSPEQDMESEAEHKKESSDMSFAKHPTSSVYNQPHRSMSLDTKMYHDHDQLADRASLPEAGLNASRYGGAVQSSISSGSRSPSPPPAFSTFPYRDEPPHADRFLETAMHSPSAQLTNHSRFSRSVSTSDVDMSRRFYDAYSDRSSPMSHLQRLSPTNHASSVSKAVDPATHFNQCFRSPLPSESPLHLSIPPPRSVICPSFMSSPAYYNLSQNQSAFLKRKMTPDEEDQLLYRRHMDTSTDYSLNRDSLKSEIDAYHYDIGTRNVDSFYRRHFDVPEDGLNRRLGGGISDEKYVVSAFNHPSSVRSFSGFR